MICPKCLAIETEGSLRCRKCGAQLYTGLFQKPDDPPEEVPKPQESGGSVSRRANVIALLVFIAVVLVLLVVMSRLQTAVQ